MSIYDIRNNDNVEYVSPEELVDNLPIETGDTVWVSSNVIPFVMAARKEGKEFNLDRFIDLLQQKVGTSGNLLFPTFNWGFCHGEGFNYRTTLSVTGTLSNVALNRSDFVRTKHPIYSFAVWGDDKDKLFRMNDMNSFRGDTPFCFVNHKPKAKFMMLGGAYGITFVHYVEECEGVPYRYLKEFTGAYIDENGKCSERKCTMFVRYLNANVKPREDLMEKLLLKEGVWHQCTLHNHSVSVVSFVDMYKVFEDDIRRNACKMLSDYDLGLVRRVNKIKQENEVGFDKK